MVVHRICGLNNYKISRQQDEQTTKAFLFIDVIIPKPTTHNQQFLKIK